ncbi:unnamed protein product [Arctia plantaginis]|uniref:Uncharacterized protein n=1 Tax=Arctia plantaginis TaxID=874455 RepID=A0A8S1ADH6_ARCPL|nr:unnamed protein product [Arctia plantaginis]
MSTVKRTPPKKKQTDNPRQIHTSSESDISSAALTSDLVKMNRNKRPRSADSPQGGSTLDFQNLQNTLSSWREEQDSKLATILADIVEIKTQNTHIKESNDEIRKTNEELKVSISFINKQFEDLKKEVEELKRERQGQQRNIENLERKIMDLQHKSRSSAIELRNIPQENAECCNTLTKTISKVVEVVGVQVSDYEIRDIYRLPDENKVSPKDGTKT